MSSILFWVLIILLLFGLPFYKFKVSNTNIIKDVDFEIKYEATTKRLYVESVNKEKCGNQNYYINENCKIVSSLGKIDENNTELCLNKKNKCSYISNYIFQNLGIKSITKRDFSNLFHSNRSTIKTQEKCNKEVHLNEKIKCTCCEKEIPNTTEGEVEGKEKGTNIDNNNYYHFKDCKCILHYEVEYDDTVTPNKCESFTCTDGFCTLLINGEPFCSCFDNFYFDKNRNAYSQNNNSQDHSLNRFQSVLDPKNRLNINHTYNKACQANQIRNEQGNCEDKDDHAIEDICFRLECFINSNKPECACVNKKREKIGNNIFDVSNINLCTLNNINCDYGKCNNLLKKEELGCICDENYKYDKSLKVCISSSLTGLLNYILLLVLFALITSVL
ncbi:hypothetical protein MKS88_002229 [Plasmodium brasilianum]|uniref:Uncharacterized protein n=1 Tax=Plasmodium brasilianum TaxID=5824 RepID=A0ACB9YBH9_PLABR|nr:hypothetical protein MKS88_002229 [Plasmodium brasilianum]